MATYFEWRKNYIGKLSSIYSPEEAQQLFFIVLEHLVGISRTNYLLKTTENPTIALEVELQNVLLRLLENEPIQYILGTATFCGREFVVNRSVLIPRPETQELVEWIAEQASFNARILDIATGSGCIAITLKKQLPKAQLWGWDISREALEVAALNAQRLKAQVFWEEKNALELPIMPCRFDIIVSNPPYICPKEKAQMHPNVLDFEPHLALFVPQDNPLVFYQHITDFAIEHLMPNGQLFFEINQYLAQETLALLHQRGFLSTILREDFRGNKRMIMARRTNGEY